MTVKDVSRFEWCGGHLFLDFLNTANEWDHREEKGEYLHHFQSFLLWCELGDILQEKQAVKLRDYAQDHPREEAQALNDVLKFRALGISMALRLAHQRAPDVAMLQAFESYLRASLNQANLVFENQIIVWQISRQGVGLWEPLWYLVQQAWQFFQINHRQRLKTCPTPAGCGWFFLDQSKNKSRRWCSMQTCGNNAKVRRFHQRSKSSR